jgi:heme/copper-type cytochrome/quinol oxidase subunit 3
MNTGERFRAANRREHGLPLVLAFDLALFCVFLICYFVTRIRTPIWPKPFHFPSGLMTVSMAMFAIAASFVMHIAVKSNAQKDKAMTQRMIALALVGWATFLFLLAMEWARLYLVEHVALLTNPWGVTALGVFYYGLTAFAAGHIVAGVVWLIAAAQNPQRWRLSSLTLFVDFTNALFIVVAFVVILSATDLGGF